MPCNPHGYCLAGLVLFALFSGFFGFLGRQQSAELLISLKQKRHARGISIRAFVTISGIYRFI
jgi:hypothetical protein